jgi:hypothetical protein
MAQRGETKKENGNTPSGVLFAFAILGYVMLAAVILRWLSQQG